MSNFFKKPANEERNIATEDKDIDYDELEKQVKAYEATPKSYNGFLEVDDFCVEDRVPGVILKRPLKDIS